MCLLSGCATTPPTDEAPLDRAPTCVIPDYDEAPAGANHPATDPK